VLYQAIGIIIIVQHGLDLIFEFYCFIYLSVSNLEFSKELVVKRSSTYTH
jgi:hypothetical protein